MLEKMIEGYEQAFGEESEARDFQKRAAEVNPNRDAALVESIVETSGRGAHRRYQTDNSPGKALLASARKMKSAKSRNCLNEKTYGGSQLRSVHATTKAPIKVLDAAYWMKGCSSLGRLRYAVVLGIGEPP